MNDTPILPLPRLLPALLILVALFLTPGFLAPIGLLQLVGGLWVLAALLTAVRDVIHVSA